MLTVTLAAGSNSHDMGTLLEGDANNDNYVMLLDFSILADAFGKCEGTTGYDARADFNGDNCIILLDFSLLASNFAQGGDARRPATLARSSQPLNDVNMLIQPASTSVKPRELFTVSVQIEAGSQTVDGAQATLNFDPALLEVVQMTAEGEILPEQLMNEFDNQRGSINFAAGTFENFPSGTFDVVQVQFRALAAVEETTLTYQFDKPQDSNVTFGGASVLGGAVDGVISVRDEATAIKVHSLAAPATAQPLWLLLLLGLIVAAGLWLRTKVGKNWA
jgi:hypothetical protein